MITSKEREKAFRKDFYELLTKHKAEFEITDDGKDYGMHKGIVIITMMNEFDNDGNQASEFTEFKL